MLDLHFRTTKIFHYYDLLSTNYDSFGWNFTILETFLKTPFIYVQSSRAFLTHFPLSEMCNRSMIIQLWFYL